MPRSRGITSASWSALGLSITRTIAVLVEKSAMSSLASSPLALFARTTRRCSMAAAVRGSLSDDVIVQAARAEAASSRKSATAKKNLTAMLLQDGDESRIVPDRVEEGVDLKKL